MLPSEYVAKGWCQEVSAIDANDQPVGNYSLMPTAVKWCAFGAIHAATESHTISGAHRDDLMDIMRQKVALKTNHVCGSFIEWQDEPERTMIEVFELLRECEVEYLGKNFVEEALQ